MPASVLKETFHKIPKKKQDHIIRCALKEFSKRGLSGTNILDVAKRAKISVGSLYTYVDSKDELYVAVAETLVDQMIEEFEKLVLTDAFMDNVALMFAAVEENAKKQRDGVRFYFDMMTEMVTPKIKDVSMKLEAAKLAKYMEAIDRAIELKEIRPNIDRSLLAFLLDSYLQTFQLAITTTHARNKAKLYFGTSSLDELGEKMIEHFKLSYGKVAYRE